MGNRCGHNRDQLRFCDLAKRGRGGQPQVIGVVCAYLREAATKMNRLTSWQQMNESGRQRRSESRERMASTAQGLFSREYQIDSRRCARVTPEGHVAPDMRLVALDISRKGKAWKGAPMSEARVRMTVREFVACGYIKLSHQQRRQMATGEWQASPKIITFTKKFFVELGGKGLWKKVLKASSDRAAQLLCKFQQDAEALARYFRIDRIFSPGQHRRQRGAPPGSIQATPTPNP
ncbi:hypothetical protein [Microbulbifer sp. SAOS-129_SWC]|uniref:hypothetical protein n=1 Tax=Microbulbifer sp. SAOS-129_SWC TaxID=3145235 RepID=UPI003216921C